MTQNISHRYVPKSTNHLLHLCLTGITCGLWAPVWATVAIYNALTRDKETTVTTVGSPPGAWYGPVAYPYAVGPGAPTSAQNPAPPVPPVPTPPMPLRPSGSPVFLPGGELAFGPRCGQCEGCRTGSSSCIPRDGQQNLPPASPPQGS